MARNYRNRRNSTHSIVGKDTEFFKTLFTKLLSNVSFHTLPRCRDDFFCLVDYVLSKKGKQNLLKSLMSLWEKHIPKIKKWNSPERINDAKDEFLQESLSQKMSTIHEHDSLKDILFKEIIRILTA